MCGGAMLEFMIVNTVIVFTEDLAMVASAYAFEC